MSTAVIAAAIVFALVLLSPHPAGVCPRCTATLPRVRLPRSFRQAMYGGWTCRSCRAEVSRFGTLRQER